MSIQISPAMSTEKYSLISRRLSVWPRTHISFVIAASVVISYAWITPFSSARRPVSYTDRLLPSYRHWLPARTSIPFSVISPILPIKSLFTKGIPPRPKPSPVARLTMMLSPAPSPPPIAERGDGLISVVGSLSYQISRLPDGSHPGVRCILPQCGRGTRRGFPRRWRTPACAS